MQRFEKACGGSDCHEQYPQHNGTQHARLKRKTSSKSTHAMMGLGALKPLLPRLELLTALDRLCSMPVALAKRKARQVRVSGKIDLCPTVSCTNPTFIRSTGSDTTPQTTQTYAQLSGHPAISRIFCSFRVFMFAFSMFSAFTLRGISSDPHLSGVRGHFCIFAVLCSSCMLISKIRLA